MKKQIYIAFRILIKSSTWEIKKIIQGQFSSMVRKSLLSQVGMKISMVVAFNPNKW